ncbi:endonuclease/exonuclease/phosphatase family protein, partial [Bosea sp. (in: a-proteobacteria)]|uniref:endonuclease/exonuclease/phosphatase family protein n=1 Tax=Bosea sp. (in: a-proteobacteria) TaxID=1871050 RepID=UPI004033F80B
MEEQRKCFCLVHAINMAMGRPMINPNDVLTHCNHLATHLQDLASRARGENKHIPLPDRTPHIYDEEGNFNIHSMNHYLYHNYKTLHLATQELPQDNITRATLGTLMGNGDNHISNAAILINRNHATTLRYLDNTWYWLDSQATHARQLLTTADWKELQGGLILLKQGMQHKNLIEPIFWLADPLEQATTTQLEQHYQRPDPIDLSGHDDQPPAIPPPAATPPSLATSNNDLKRKNTSAEADPPTRSRHREAATTKEDAATPPPPTRNEKPRTKTGPKKPRSKKGARNISHSKEGHTQTLMSRYLTTTQAAPTATTSSPSVPCPTTEAPPNIPTQAHQTPSRQHLTLTTLNVRGLYRARRDVAHLIHHHHPDILILTETKTQHKKATPGWLRVATQDYTLHRHGGHSEVLIGIKHDLAIQTQATLAPPSTEAEVNSRCVILTLSQHHSDNLTIVATYWPSGCNEDALPLRETMQQHIRTATRHLPGSLILAGDLNATMKTEDRSEHTEYT